jgi:hypothetical protein
MVGEQDGLEIVAAPPILVTTSRHPIVMDGWLDGWMEKHVPLLLTGETPDREESVFHPGVRVRVNRRTTGLPACL